MRFADLPPTARQQTDPLPEAGSLLQWLGGKGIATRLQPDPTPPAEPPLDLDQRIRLVGEW